MRGSPFSFTNFSRGLNVLDSPYTLQQGESRDCLNMVSSPRGAVKKRYGSSVFASGTAGYFPTLGATDTFERANENPLSNGGKWTAFNTNAGAIVSNTWTPNGSTFQTSWAYWNVAEQTNPAVSVKVAKLGFRMYLFTCLNAGATHGYQLEFNESENVSFPNEYTVNLYRFQPLGEGGTVELGQAKPVTIFEGDSIGISVRNGLVTAWKLHAGVWSQILQVSDATFTKGFSGVGGFLAGVGRTSPHFQQFAVGELPTPPAESEFTSLLPCVIGTTNYLIAVAGKKIFSVTEAGEFNDITGGATVTEGLRWSIIQSTSGAPNRVTTNGPIYLSNGVDPPLYWTGATKTTAVAEWTGAPAAGFVAVPKAKYLTYMGNRVWASGINGDPSAVRWSGFAVKTEEGSQADPTSWPKEQVVWFEKEDGEPITGTGIAGPYVLVFKKHKVWSIYDLNEGENRRISDSVGCISFRSIVETPQGTFFLTPDQGVFVTNGTTVKEVSRNVRPILQGTDPYKARAAKLDQLENTAAGYLNGHYYLSYMAQDGSMKTLDYDTVLQSWWLHDLAGNQWVHWEPQPGSGSLYTIPHKAKTGVIRAFVPGLYQDSGVNYVGAKSLTCYWLSPWEPFWQYFMRHRFAQPNPKKRIRELFIDGSGQVIALVGKKFEGTLEEIKGTVDNADMAMPTSPLTLGTGGGELAGFETQAARYWSLGTSRVWSFGFGNNSAEPLEIDSYSVHLNFRKS